MPLCGNANAIQKTNVAAGAARTNPFQLPQER